MQSIATSISSLCHQVPRLSSISLFRPHHVILSFFWGPFHASRRRSPYSTSLLLITKPKMFGWFTKTNTTSDSGVLPPTPHGSQGTTAFAQYLLQLPEQKWETETAKFQLYNNNQRVADLRQFGPPLAMRQALFNRSPFAMDLNANDLLNGFTGLGTKNLECHYLTPCHDPLTTWAQHIKPDSIFYICPYVDRKDFPRALASTSQWMFSLKGKFEQSQARLRGWMVVPGWDKSTFARKYLMTASGPAIILKQWISEIHVFHQTAPQRAALRNGSIQISEGHVSDMPLVAMFLDSSKSSQDPILFQDHHLGPRPMNWGLQKANIGRVIEESVSIVRSDASHDLLKKFFFERTTAIASQSSNAKPTAFVKEDSRAFHEFLCGCCALAGMGAIA